MKNVDHDPTGTAVQMVKEMCRGTGLNLETVLSKFPNYISIPVRQRLASERNTKTLARFSEGDDPSMHNLTTVTEVVADIIENMSEADKATVVNTPENDLIQFYLSLGTAIRKDYNLWRNPALVTATGEEHPDAASMVIIKAVWQALHDAHHYTDT